jgi:hypothetical protein
VDLQVSKPPVFVMKFKYFKKGKWLGYIFNNNIGVIYEDGEHIIGHNKREFKYIEELIDIDSEILIDNTESFNQSIPSLKKTIFRHQPRLTPSNTIHKD